MGKRANPRPTYLPAKLIAIRKTLGLTQTQLANILKVGAARVSEFELGRRTPNLILLLYYARLARIPMEFLVVDEIDVPYFTEYVEAKYRGEVTVPVTLFMRK